MKARRKPHPDDDRRLRWTDGIDALHRHCDRARSLAALLALCGEVDPGEIDAEAVGYSGRWIVEELDALRGCVRALEEAR